MSSETRIHEEVAGWHRLPHWGQVQPTWGRIGGQAALQKSMLSGLAPPARDRWGPEMHFRVLLL